ncbi:MAG TPA: glutamate--tRNA ligase [Dehalococcoidia bacterium]|nr:glutamate--tRNA ligase [Dehalococcoidia bacterium]
MTVRVRYAPSPTGIPHVGNIRTALFNWLLARHHGGVFILRIEDTDRARYDPRAVDAIMESLRWLGLDWDEGPDVGGPYAPYVQSERLPLYQEAAERLLRSGHAYRCYCSPERLEMVRAEQMRQKIPPKYDRHCRLLSEEEARERGEPGAKPVIRFKTPLSGITRFEDAIRGEVEFDNETLDDFVILKSDGYPTYHLAHLVDDHEMRITHVLRGDEWISSAPRHVLMYEAFGWDPPVFAHLPVILGPDKAKLSKRHGATSVLEYRDQGYLPEALFNFLGLLGWSLDDRTVIISREQFIRHFDLSRVVKNPAIFDRDKLDWMNGVYIRELPEERLVDLLTEWLESHLPARVPRPIDREVVRRAAPLVRERIKRLDESVAMMDFFFWDEIHYSREELLGKAYAADPEGAARALTLALESLEQVTDWRHEAIEAPMRALAERLGVKTGALFGLVRVAVTGKSVSPPLFESMAIVGKERCLRRLHAALDLLGRPD